MSPSASPGDDRFSARAASAGFFALRAAVGAVLVFWLVPVSVDDHFRVFHASWWWDHPSFTSSYDWLPGHQYLYGPLVGLSGDTVLVPRAATLALMLLAGALLLADRAEGRACRWIASVWLLAAPLSLVLGAAPLTEAQCLALLFAGVLGLRRYLESGEPIPLLGAAVAYLAASTIRYEVWALVPVFALLALSRRPARAGGPARVLAFLPAAFPLAWFALVWAVEGEPFTFLSIVQDDHFGAGSLAAALGRPPAAVVSPSGAGSGAVRADRDRRAASVVFEEARVHPPSIH